MRRFGTRSLVFLAVLGIALLVMPYASAPSAHALTLFNLRSYINTGTVCGGTFKLALDQPVGCSNASIVGIAVDPFANVVYAVDGQVEGKERLVRIDGSSDTVFDSYTLPNCNDPRRPALSRASGTVKIYIGCEFSRDVLVLKVNGGRLGSISVVTRIPLKVAGATDAYEPKTLRINDSVSLGKLYVVGDENTAIGRDCSDPAFVISTFSDRVEATNSRLGTPAFSNSNCLFDSGFTPGSNQYTGINDVAIGPFGVYWFNEDDAKVYRTNQFLQVMSVSLPVRVDCGRASQGQGGAPTVISPVAEDAPKFGAVIGNQVLASAPESLAPCNRNPETGGLYTLTGTTLNASIATPNFAANRVEAAGLDFLVANQANSGTATNCTPSCMAVVTPSGFILQMVQLSQSQNDVAYNPISRKAYLSLDNNSNGQDVAVIQGP